MENEKNESFFLQFFLNAFKVYQFYNSNDCVGCIKIYQINTSFHQKKNSKLSSKKMINSHDFEAPRNSSI